MNGMNTDSICIVGPTACHKTETAIKIAKQFNGEIISADSVQVYRGMDIGSAKPTPEERQGVAHHALDCVDIDAPHFSVAQYREIAKAAIQDVKTRGKPPVIAGGSGLYVHALTHALTFASLPGDEAVRKEIEEEYERDRHATYAGLLVVDESTTSRISPNDKKRVVRALEIYRLTGKKPSECGGAFRSGEVGEAPVCSPIMIGLTMDRAALYRRIELRVDQMMANGLLEEARTIYCAGYDRTLPAMQSIGYKELFLAFDGDCSLDDAVDRIKLNTRHYAKRQWTWFKREQEIKWFDVTSYDDTVILRIEEAIRKEQNGVS